MKIQEFVKACLRTESIPVDVGVSRETVVRKFRLLHAALGLNTEMDELRLTYGVSNSREGLIATIEELSDAEWYCALAIDALQIVAPDSESCADISGFSILLFKQVNEFADLAKKHACYGRHNWRELKDCLISIVSIIGNLRHEAVARLMYQKSGFITFAQSQDACRTGLIAKLARRYPERFSDVEERDGVSEMDAFLKASGLFQS